MTGRICTNLRFVLAFLCLLPTPVFAQSDAVAQSGRPELLKVEVRKQTLTSNGGTSVMFDVFFDGASPANLGSPRKRSSAEKRRDGRVEARAEERAEPDDGPSVFMYRLRRFQPWVGVASNVDLFGVVQVGPMIGGAASVGRFGQFKLDGRWLLPVATFEGEDGEGSKFQLLQLSPGFNIFFQRTKVVGFGFQVNTGLEMTRASYEAYGRTVRRSQTRPVAGLGFRFRFNFGAFMLNVGVDGQANPRPKRFSGGPLKGVVSMGYRL